MQPSLYTVPGVLGRYLLTDGSPETTISLETALGKPHLVSWLNPATGIGGDAVNLTAALVAGLMSTGMPYAKAHDAGQDAMRRFRDSEREPKIVTWADGFGLWHAAVPIGEHEAELALAAITAELGEREPRLDRTRLTVDLEGHTNHGTAKYVEVWQEPERGTMDDARGLSSTEYLDVLGHRIALMYHGHGMRDWRAMEELLHTFVPYAPVVENRTW